MKQWIKPALRAGIPIAIGCAAGAAYGQSTARERATVLMSENTAEREFQEGVGYADAVIVDGTAYLSGVVTGYGGGEETFEDAYERTFQRLGKTLERAGAHWGDVVDMTSYHTDLTTQLGPLTKVKNRYIKAPFPAWTAIGVSRLIPDSGITEIKLIARLANAKK